MDAEFAIPTDPTLGGVADVAPIDPVFPDTADSAHLVLYQTANGGLQLRWHLDAAALRHARDAFGDGLDPPTPVLRLYRLNGEGASRIIADAPLEDRHLATDGFASCFADGANGLLEAEIGLRTAAGGWALVARSNRLQAVTPTGAAFLRESASSLTAPVAAIIGAARMPISTATPPPSQEADSSASAFPLSQPEPEPEPDRRRDSLSPVAETQTAMPLLRVDSGEFSLAADGPETDQRFGIAFGRRMDSSSQFGGGSGGVSGGVSGGLPAGSGPALVFRADAGGGIGAELLVHGSAAPGSLLDLGGHPYRVGAGGRFSFRVPLTDKELIMRLLAIMPELPVESRPGNE